MKAGRVVVVAATTAKLAVRYGPQAKLAWDNGGKQGAAAAARRAQALNARRRALRHAGTVIDGSALRVTHEGRSVYVVLSGEEPVAAYPSPEVPLETLLEHADRSRRLLPPAAPPARA